MTVGSPALADRLACLSLLLYRDLFSKEGKQQIAKAVCGLIEEGNSHVLEGRLLPEFHG